MSRKNLVYCNQFFLWIYYLLRFLCFHRSIIWHTLLGGVPSLHGCGWPFCLGLCFLNLLNCLHHWLFQPFFFLLVNNTLCFLWFSILEHMFFNCLTSCCDINIHHIHFFNDCLYFNNRLNFCCCYTFPMKHLLHLIKLWKFCHFMSIQTIDVACIWRFLLWFLIRLCYLHGCHYGLLLLSACLHIVISHSTICSILVNLPYITFFFGGAACLILCGTLKMHSLLLQ